MAKRKFFLGLLGTVAVAAKILYFGAGVSPAAETIKVGGIQAPAQADPNEQPGVSLPFEMNGSAAVRALGETGLAKVAATYKRTAARLRETLLSDPTLHVDREGKLFYIDAAQVANATEVAGAMIPPPGPFPYADTFRLHSRPGAKRTIYLDFDGHTITGSDWNKFTHVDPIVCPPFNLDFVDGFETSELDAIQYTWQLVAEDFAPYDVDVTTEFVSESLLTRSTRTDEYYGMRVVVSDLASLIGQAGGGYVGAFDDVGDGNKPAVVCPDGLGYVVKNIAEACTHETGHNLGLDHDGTLSGVEYYWGHGYGETSWGPIMGSAYAANLGQWSKGEYYDANNTQDDLQVMTRYGISFRADDHGSTMSTATQLPPGPMSSATGFVGLPSDTDVFAFTSEGGEATISIVPEPPAPNLDAMATVSDAWGVVLGRADDPGRIGADLAMVLPAPGTYYVTIQGTGAGDPLTTYSAYGSLGKYTLTVGLSTGLPANQLPNAVASVWPAAVSPILYANFDGTGSFDADGSIIAYSWAFGDGMFGSGATAQHLYSQLGTYTTTLTVTDDRGGIGTAQLAVVVEPDPSSIMRVAGYLMSTASGGSQGVATVVVSDLNGEPLSGVTVTGTWSGVVAGSGSAVTDSFGRAGITSKRTRKAGIATFTVTGLTRNGLTYVPANNQANSGSVQLTP